MVGLWWGGGGQGGDFSPPWREESENDLFVPLVPGPLNILLQAAQELVGRGCPLPPPGLDLVPSDM